MNLNERANKGLHNFVVSWLQSQHWYAPAATSLLDIGCGTGAFLSLCKPQGFMHLYGIDMDIRQFGLPDVQVSQFNLDIFSTESFFGRFNLITALELLEHLHNPGKLFQLISAHLAPGGRAIITTPNIHSIAARLLFLIRGRLPHFDNRSDATHVYPVYLENLERVLPHYGLKIEQVAFFPPKGHQLYGKSTIALSKGLSFLIPERYRGDNLLLVLTRA